MDYQIVNQKDSNPNNNRVYSTLLQPITMERTASSNKFLYLAAATANLIAFVCGISFGWTSPMIPKLNGSIDPINNPLTTPITSSEESWITGLLSLGSALGPLAAGRTADKIGRKRTLLVVSLPIIVSFLTTSFATTVPLYYFARLFLGFGVGSVFAVLPMYLSEIAQNHNRGTLSCFMGIFITSGLLFSLTIGPLLTVKNFTLICLIPIVIFILIFSVFIPESPQFLVSINDNRGAEKSLEKLRPKNWQIQKELMTICNNEKTDQRGFRDLIKSKTSRKGLIVCLGLIILQQFAGINVVICYMQSIFDSTGSSIPAETSSVIVGAIQVVATIATSSMVDRLGRKILLLVSSFVSCLSLAALGAFFYFKNSNYDVKSIFWLPVVSLVVYIITFNIGLGPLPWTVMGEIFPANVKSTASTLTTFVCFMTSFVITLFFPFLSTILGMAQSFWIFSICCLLGTVFIYIVVPETKGKDIQEIQKLLE